MTGGITAKYFILFFLLLLPILKTIENPMGLLVQNRFGIHSSILILKLPDSYVVIRGKM